MWGPMKCAVPKIHLNFTTRSTVAFYNFNLLNFLLTELFPGLVLNPVVLISRHLFISYLGLPIIWYFIVTALLSLISSHVQNFC